MPRSYYDVLGVSPNASATEIRQAYRDLALIYHPDKAKNNYDQEKWNEIVNAYETLKNPDLRARYDSGGRNYSGDRNYSGSEPLISPLIKKIIFLIFVIVYFSFIIFISYILNKMDNTHNNHKTHSIKKNINNK
jgi:DnaJ-class molecular chaperone